jgi:Protein of unknown function (DUF4239)
MKEVAMTTVMVGALVVLGSVLLALAGLVLVHRLVPAQYREPSNFVAGLIYMPIGGLYGILICFAAFLVWSQFNAADATTEREASELAAIYWHAEKLPESERQQVQGFARSYAQIVIEEEWPLMEQGKDSSNAWDMVDNLRRSIDGFEPNTSLEQNLHAQEVAQIDEMLKDRRLRLLQSRQGMPPILWVILLTGIIVLVGFTYLFGMKNFRAHMLMVAILTAVLVGTTFSIREIEYPFSHDTQVKPSAFELVLNRFQADANRNYR